MTCPYRESEACANILKAGSEDPIKLTGAQVGALQCSWAMELLLGTVKPETPGEFAIMMAWDGGNVLSLPGREQRGALLDEIIDMANSEDAVAEDRKDKGAQGACTALTNLALKVAKSPSFLNTGVDNQG